MKRNSLLSLSLLFISLLFVAGKCDDPAPPTLKDLVKGKTWRLGTVTKDGTSVTTDFTGFELTINSEGTSGTIKTGGTNSQTVNVTYSIATNSISLSGTVPTGWANTLTDATAASDGKTFTFKVTITSQKTGPATFVFNLVN